METEGSAFVGRIQNAKDEHENIQIKVFTNWINAHLRESPSQMVVKDLLEDIKSGFVLIELIGVIYHVKLRKEKPPKLQRIHQIQNVETVLSFLTNERKIKLVNINATDVVSGKSSIVLGLIWKIILDFQIRVHHENMITHIQSKEVGAKIQTAANLTSKQAIITKVNNILSETYGLSVRDLGPSWRDAMAFSSIVHSISSDIIDLDHQRALSNIDRLDFVFNVAESHLNVPRILDPIDIDVDNPDQKSIMLYTSHLLSCHDRFKKEEEEQRELTRIKMLEDELKNSLDHHLDLTYQKQSDNSNSQDEVSSNPKENETNEPKSKNCLNDGNIQIIQEDLRNSILEEYINVEIFQSEMDKSQNKPTDDPSIQTKSNDKNIDETTLLNTEKTSDKLDLVSIDNGNSVLDEDFIIEHKDSYLYIDPPLGVLKETEMNNIDDLSNSNQSVGNIYSDKSDEFKVDIMATTDPNNLNKIDEHENSIIDKDSKNKYSCEEISQLENNNCSSISIDPLQISIENDNKIPCEVKHLETLNYEVEINLEANCIKDNEEDNVSVDNKYVDGVKTDSTVELSIFEMEEKGKNQNEIKPTQNENLEKVNEDQLNEILTKDQECIDKNKVYKNEEEINIDNVPLLSDADFIRNNEEDSNKTYDDIDAVKPDSTFDLFTKDIGNKKEIEPIKVENLENLDQENLNKIKIVVTHHDNSEEKVIYKDEIEINVDSKILLSNSNFNNEEDEVRLSEKNDINVEYDENIDILTLDSVIDCPKQDIEVNEEEVEKLLDVNQQTEMSKIDQNENKVNKDGVEINSLFIVGDNEKDSSLDTNNLNSNVNDSSVIQINTAIDLKPTQDVDNQDVNQDEMEPIKMENLESVCYGHIDEITIQMTKHDSIDENKIKNNDLTFNEETVDNINVDFKMLHNNLFEEDIIKENTDNTYKSLDQNEVLDNARRNSTHILEEKKDDENLCDTKNENILINLNLASDNVLATKEQETLKSNLIDKNEEVTKTKVDCDQNSQNIDADEMCDDEVKLRLKPTKTQSENENKFETSEIQDKSKLTENLSDNWYWLLLILILLAITTYFVKNKNKSID